MADTAHSGTSIVGGHAAADGTNAGFMTSANFTKLGLYPAVSGLTTGQCIRATGAATMAFGALDLANANAVTGVLPAGNRAAPTAAETVTALAGAASAIDVNGQRIGNGGDPSSAQDFGTKSYIDAKLRTLFTWQFSNSAATASLRWAPSAGGTVSASAGASTWLPACATTVKAIYALHDLALSTDTNTYTMYLNTVSQSMTCQVAAAGTAANGSGSVAVAAGDKVQMATQQSSTQSLSNMQPRISLSGQA